MLLKIGTLDVSQWLTSYSVEYEYLLSEKGSGRNVYGTMMVDVVAKKDKIICEFSPMTSAEAQTFLTAIEPYVVSVTYLNPKTGATKTIRAYISTPKVERNLVDGMTKKLSLNFIEL